MTRRLTVTPVEVPPERTEAYLAAAAELASLVRRRGEHFWLFRHAARSDRFLEFHEWPEPRRAGDPDSRAAAERLRALAPAGAEAEDQWLEVPLNESA